MLRILFCLLVSFCLLAPEAAAQRRSQVPAEKIGDLTLASFRAHLAERVNLRETREQIRANDYATVLRTRQAIARDTKTLDQNLSTLMERGAISQADARLYRTLSDQDNAEGARAVAVEMLMSPSIITASLGASIQFLLDEPQQALPQAQQGGSTSGGIGGGLANIDWTKAAKNGAAGAVIGGMIGGGVSAAIGAAIGSLASIIGDFLNGYNKDEPDDEGGDDSGDGDSGGGGDGGDGGGTPSPSPVPSP